MTYTLTDGQLDPPASAENIENLYAQLGVRLPDSYLEFLRQHNGGEGFIAHNYVVFWKAEELAKFNRDYQVEVYAPGIILFGTNGGGEGYGFDFQHEARPIVMLPLIGMERRYARIVAKEILDMFSGRVVWD